MGGEKDAGRIVCVLKQWLKTEHFGGPLSTAYSPGVVSDMTYV